MKDEGKKKFNPSSFILHPSSLKSKSAARQTLKEILSAPFTSVGGAYFPNQPANGCREKARTRFRESRRHAGDLQLRDTPLLSSARRSQRTRLRLSSIIVMAINY
jgi:hypothetical protein